MWKYSWWTSEYHEVDYASIRRNECCCSGRTPKADLRAQSAAKLAGKWCPAETLRQDIGA